MKSIKKTSLLGCLLIFIASPILAQSPDSLSSQAVIRDNTGKLVANQNIGMDISILQGSGSGTSVYEEKQMPVSYENGMVSLVIGSGAKVGGSIKTIDWNAGTYFIKVQTDPAGGTNYTINSTNQILSVPYALHVAVADSVSGFGRHYVGESFGSGVVFYVYDNGQHGLIAATSDQSSGVVWSTDYVATAANRSGVNAAVYNTTQIIAKEGANGSAVNLCANYQGGGFGDWY